MKNIPEPILNNFLVELDMYCRHLDYVLKELDELEQKMIQEFGRIKDKYDPEQFDEGEVWARALGNILGIDTNFGP